MCSRKAHKLHFMLALRMSRYIAELIAHVVLYKYSFFIRFTTHRVVHSSVLSVKRATLEEIDLVHMRNVHNDESCQVKRRFECPFSCGSKSSHRTMVTLLQHCEREHEHSLGIT